MEAKKPEKKELWKLTKDGKGKDDGNWCGYGMLAKCFENQKIKAENAVIDAMNEWLGSEGCRGMILKITEDAYKANDIIWYKCLEQNTIHLKVATAISKALAGKGRGK